MKIFYHSTMPTDVLFDESNENHHQLEWLLNIVDPTKNERRRIARLFVKIFGEKLHPRTDVCMAHRDEQGRMVS